MTADPIKAAWRHPRRLGFIAFNLIVLALVISWIVVNSTQPVDAPAEVPNYLLGYVGMAFVLTAWVVAWLAWAFMVVSRRRRLRRERQAG